MVNTYYGNIINDKYVALYLNEANEKCVQYFENYNDACDYIQQLIYAGYVILGVLSKEFFESKKYLEMI